MKSSSVKRWTLMTTERSSFAPRRARSAWSPAMLSVCSALVRAPAVVSAQQGLMAVLQGQDQQEGFAHATGLYAFVPPGGWSCNQLRGGAVECRTANGGAPGVATITHTTIEGTLDS